MNKKDKIIRILKKRFLYLLVIVISFGLAVYGALASNADCLEIAFGIFSGALTALIASSTLGLSEDEDVDDSKWLNLLESIAKDQHSIADDEIEIFRGTESESYNINDLIASAQKRVWILGANLTNTLMHHKEALLTCVKNSNPIDIKFLTCHHNSLFSFTRYHEIPGKTYSAMMQETYEANQVIAALREEALAINPQVNFEMRLSLVQPTVLVMIIDDYIILSHFLVNASASNNIRVLFKPKSGDSMFIGHFLDSWKHGEDFNTCCNRKGETLKLSRNGEKIYEYNVVQKYSKARSALHAVGNKLKDGFVLLGKHAKKMYAPLFFLVISLVGFIALQNIDQSQIILYNNIKSSILGIFSGAVLSIIEYIFDNHNTKKEASELLAIERERAERLKISLKDNFFNNPGLHHGIEVFHNRNAAKIEERILSAKKRVWIYATNHQYVGETNNVANYLKENKELDVKFLMLDPNSLFIDTRWAYIPGKSCAADFAQEISNNLKQLHSGYRKKRHIKTRLYTRQPNFMLYLIDDTLIISPILIQGRAREQEHICFNLLYPSVFEIANDYLEHFQKVWAESRKINAARIDYNINKSKLLTIEKGASIKLTSNQYSDENFHNQSSK